MDETTHLPLKLGRSHLGAFLKISLFLGLVLLLLFIILYSTKKADPALKVGPVIEKLNKVHGVVYVDAGADSYSQLNKFSPYSHLLNTVRCDQQPDVCQKNEVTVYPSIVLTDIGTDLEGIQTIEDLNSLFNQIGI
ncbi:MAG: hypothetical protein Q7K33_01085 [Candidatus Berkelbacteria bacterium]|nr:hypothetical protein [Candidatus Berkelbacteria bacterium]